MTAPPGKQEPRTFPPGAQVMKGRSLHRDDNANLANRPGKSKLFIRQERKKLRHPLRWLLAQFPMPLDALAWLGLPRFSSGATSASTLIQTFRKSLQWRTSKW